jgi:hypothetical protein
MDTSTAPAPDDFTHRTLRHVGKRVHRMGIACNFGLDADGFAAAIDRGANYIFWTQLRTSRVTPAPSSAFTSSVDRPHAVSTSRVS